MKKRILVIALLIVTLFNLLPVSEITDGVNSIVARVQAEEPEPEPEEEPCGHPYDKVKTFVVASCICADHPECEHAKGTGTIYYCGECGEYMYETPWTGGKTYREHEYGKIEVDLENNKIKLICTDCGSEKELPLSEEHTHQYEVTRNVDSTCTRAGYIERTCKICSNTYTENKPLLDHTYEMHVVAPTCTENGYDCYVCTACGAEKHQNFMPASGHTYGEWTLTEEPTCQKDGTETRTCTECGHIEEKIVSHADTAHDLEVIEEIPATCTENGSKTLKCKNCSLQYSVPIPASHDWQYTFTDDPTCVSVGYIHYECSVCHNAYQDIIPATGVHTWVEDENTATCEEDGFIHYHCQYCEATRTSDSKALGHEWGEWETVTSPTCYSVGQMKRVCVRGCEKTRDIPMVDHHYVNHKCEYCGHTYPVVENVINAIEALPDVSSINETTVIEAYNQVLRLDEQIDDIKNGTYADYKEALNMYADLDTLEAVREECLKYLVNIRFEAVPGEFDFNVYWNDNNWDDGAHRVSPDDFVNAANVKLNYEIVSEDGTVVISSGTISDAADANNVFEFLNLDLDDDEPIIYCEDESGAGHYILATNTQLPVGYSSYYIDYTTNETHTANYKINYTLTLENPDTEEYIATYPERTDAPVTLNKDEKVVYTQLAEWSASIEWKDDNNRSPLGGNSTAHTPRVDVDTLKEATRLFVYPMGYNVPSGDPVEGDFGYHISPDQKTITITGLPAYDNEGSPLAYYLSQTDIPAANDDYVPGNRYGVSYFNVGNVAAKTNGVYDGGTLIETLNNTVEFNVVKTWADNKTPENRPDAKFYIWRITENYDAQGNLVIASEFSYAIPNCYDAYSVPKADSSNFLFSRDMGSGVELHLFPMYDGEGRRYIYYGREKGLPAEYDSIISNDTANYNEGVIETFTELNGEEYFLSGSTITNTISERVNIPLSKTFNALSIQNKLDENTPITASFVLQVKKNGVWVNADANDPTYGFAFRNENGTEAVIGDDGSVTVTLTEFTAESMYDAFNGVSADKFDTTAYEYYDFRWLETGVSINGVSASYDPANWIEQEDGSLRYDGSVTVYDGQTSKILGDSTTQTSGPEDTTAIFNASADADNNFTNQLVGKRQVEIIKYFKDAEGNQIAADAEKMEGVEATFLIYCDNKPIETVTLTYADLVQGGDYWYKLINYDRYDPMGREYTYKVVEIQKENSSWQYTANYDTRILEYPASSDILVKRLTTVYINAPGEGALTFEVEKSWEDDSDLVTRHPIVAGIYRFQTADGVLLDEPVQIGDDLILYYSNNWFQQRVFPTADVGDNKDTIANYVVIEKGIMVDDEIVPTNYNFEWTSAALKNIRNASFTEGNPYITDEEEEPISVNPNRIYLGITGSTDKEGTEWDGLTYRYALDEYNAKTSNDHACYYLINRRIGTQDYILEKTWTAGGQVAKSKFGLFIEDTKVADFTVDIDDEDSIVVADVTWADGFNHNGVTVEAYGKTDDRNMAFKNAKGNYVAGIKISGLQKFDEEGKQINFSLQEISIFNKNGNPVLVENGKCVVDGKTFKISQNTEYIYAADDYHRAPDTYTVRIFNNVSNKYDLISNKIWRDANQLTRPDVSFSVYRMSTANPTLMAYVESGDTEGMSQYLAGFTGAGNRVMTDRYWDTHINNYWWTCQVTDLDQYDEDGFPYVYYAVEMIPSASSGSTVVSSQFIYEGYYCNETFDSNPEGYRPVLAGSSSEAIYNSPSEEVFGIPNDEMAEKAGNVFILADGIHTDSNGSFADYYSATAVNRPKMTHTVSGRKLWKMPSEWVVPYEDLPVITVELYRSLEEISYTDYASAVEYANAVIQKSVDGAVVSKQVNYGDDEYKFFFDEDKDGNALQKYDEWGRDYYYYTIETRDWTDADGNEVSSLNFPQSNIVYEDNDFNINNVFVSRAPYVEITVEKQWEVSEDVWNHLVEYGLEGLDQDDFAPAKINLSGVPLDRKGAEIKKSTFKFGSVTLRPGVADSDGDGETDTVFTAYTDNGKPVLKATYTFKTYYNNETGEIERLPYYWLHNYGINYYLKEDATGGYNGNRETVLDTRIEFNNSREDGEDTIWYNDGENVAAIRNTYDGDVTVDFDFKKVWTDKYVDNDEWRPDKVTFVIKRTVDGVIDEGFARTVDLNKREFKGKDTWTGSVGRLPKYAPSGKQYTYFVYSETITIDGVDTTVTVFDSESRALGHYSLADFTENTIINALNDDVSVDASKTWKIDGAVISTYTNTQYSGFDDLRKMGVFPKTANFIVQRTVDGTNWSYVPASSYADTVHKTTYHDEEDREINILGHLVNIDAADESNFKQVLATSMRWENLPRKDKNNNVYTYRVIEVLTWYDGTETVIVDTASAQSGIDATFTREELSDGADCTIVNDVSTRKVRIAKIWDDDNGSQNTRPASINITIKPASSTQGSKDAGMTFTLKTSGNPTTNPEANVYYSDYFYLSAGKDITYGVEGQNYDITESYTKKNGATYTATVNSEGHVHTLADGTFVLEIVNENHDHIDVDLEATKSWKSENASWKKITRPVEVTFTLLYQPQGSSTWVEFTDETLQAFTGQSGQRASQTVPYDIDTTTAKVYWYKMEKYWADPAKDGVAEPIKYRVKETVHTNDAGTSAYTLGAETTFTINYADNVAANHTGKATVTNTYTSKTVYLTKSWTKNGTTSTLTAAQVEDLINLNAIPQTLYYVVEYKTGDMTEWARIPNLSDEKSISVATLLSGQQSTGAAVPRYDKDGNEIQYRVRETAIVFKNTHKYDFIWNEDMTEAVVNNFETAAANPAYASTRIAKLTNDYDYVDKSVTKQWNDEDNRDGVRTDIEVNLYRDGKLYSTVNTGNATQLADNLCTVTKNGNSWTIKWDYLPKYQEGKEPADGNESVYTWTETVLTNYASDYDANDAARTKVENTYEPQRGSLTVTKDWEDFEDKGISTRPETVYFKLVYSTDNGTTWNDVKKNTLTSVHGKQLYFDENGGVATKAYTTSNDGWIAVTEEDGWSNSWAELPVNVRISNATKKVLYKVVEGEMVDGVVAECQNSHLNGYTIGYETVNVADNTETKTDVTNSLDITDLTVSKTWTGDSAYATLVRPSRVVFEIKYKMSDETEWKYLPAGITTGYEVKDGVSTVTVTANNSWRATVSGLPEMDAMGNTFEYQVTEARIIYIISSEEYAVEVNATDKMVGAYDIKEVVTEATYANGKYTVTAANTLKSGAIKVTKNWADGDNRDGSSQTINVQLYRVTEDASGEQITQKIGGEVTLNKSNNWTRIWTDLPVRNNNAEETTDYSEYYVKEVGENGGSITVSDLIYEVDYDDEKTIENTTTNAPAGYALKNTHTPLVTKIDATKVWNDENSKINIRPSSVTFKLQYRPANGTWADFPEDNILGTQTDLSILESKDGSEVWMVSNDTVQKTANADNNWTVGWNNLTAYVNVNGVSTLVEYRAVEITDELKNYTADNGGVSSAVTYLSTDKTVSIGNTPVTGSLTVSKKVTVNGTEATGSDLQKLITLGYMPEQLTATLSYKDGTETKTETATLTYDSSQKAYSSATFSNLPIMDAAGNLIRYTVYDSADILNIDYGTVDATIDASSKTGTALVTNNIDLGTVKVTKKWVDGENRDNLRKYVDIVLEQANGSLTWTKTLTSEDGNSVIFEDIPVYKDVTGTTPVKYEYEVEEVGGASYMGYTVTYSDNVTLTKGSESSITVTNTHIPYVMGFDAEKDWGNDTTKINVRPQSIDFKLQYRIGATGEWADFPEANILGTQSDLSILETKDGSEVWMVSNDTVVKTADASNNWKVGWNNLTAYALLNGHAELVYYRAVEITDNLYNYTPQNGGISAPVNYDSETKSVTINNDLNLGSITVAKRFNVNGTEVTGDDLYKFVKTLGLMPEELTVTLSYKDGTDTKTETRTLKFNEQTKAYTPVTFTDLPVKYADGTDIHYTVSDGAGYTSIVYGTVDAVVSDTPAVVVNNIETGVVTVEKNWMDGDNRDNSRKAIAIALMQDGVEYGTATLNAANGYKYDFVDLPVYKDITGTTPVKYVYSVVETAADEDGVITYDDGTEYKVTYSKGVTIEGGRAAAGVTNTYVPKVTYLNATKEWIDEIEKLNVRPESINFTLQYKAGDGNWTDFPEANVINDGEVSDLSALDGSKVYMIADCAVTQTLSDSNDWTASWKNLTAYVNVNGVSVPVQYRAKEDVASLKNYIAYNDGVSEAVTVDSTSHDVKITNEVVGGFITVNKKVTVNGTEVSGDKLYEYVVTLGLLPENLELTLTYYDGTEKRTESGSLVFDREEKAYKPFTFNGMPIADAEGTPIQYTVSDSAQGFASVVCGSVPVTIEGEGITTAITNSIDVGSLTVTKTWADGYNRDGGEKEITVVLKQNGNDYKTAKLNAANKYTYTFTDLPVYSDAAASPAVKYVYSVVEQDEQGGKFTGDRQMQFEVTYSDAVQLAKGETAKAGIINKHIPLTFEVDASKLWNDNKDQYKLRPDVTLRLTWAYSEDSETWTPVAHTDTPISETTDGTVVTTTSAVQQKLVNGSYTEHSESWTGAKWENLPAYVLNENGDSVLVYYKVQEIGNLPASYSSTSSTALCYNGENSVSATVVNSLTGKTFFTVYKNWIDNEYAKRPDAITVQLQYTDKENPAEEDWKDVLSEGLKTLTAEGETPWTYTWLDLRNDYKYRALEVNMIYGETVIEAPKGLIGQVAGYDFETTVSKDDNGNPTQGTIVNTLITGRLEVTKVWNDSDNRDNLRPVTLTFDLYRDDEELPMMTKDVTVTADGMEACVFENLPVYKDGSYEYHTYYVVEHDNDGYTIEYEATADNAISFKESEAQTVTVTNVHESLYFNVEATKTWDDNDNQYGLRPEEVELKLQYSFDPTAEEWTDVEEVEAVPDPAEDDGTRIYTTSPLIQNLSKKDVMDEKGNIWGMARWENLPAFALAPEDAEPTDDGGEPIPNDVLPEEPEEPEAVTRKVYYRVVEVENDYASYDCIYAGPFCFDDAADSEDLTVIDDVINPLANKTKLTVNKYWKDNNSHQLDEYMAECVTVELQYRADEKSPWLPVPENARVELSSKNEWSATYDDLPIDYQYRCIEVGMKNGLKKWEINKIDEDLGMIQHCVIYTFTSSSVTEIVENEDGSFYYVTKTENTLNDIPFTGDNMSLGIAGVTMAVSVTGMVTLIALAKRRRKEAE